MNKVFVMLFLFPTVCLAVRDGRGYQKFYDSSRFYFNGKVVDHVDPSVNYSNKDKYYEDLSGSTKYRMDWKNVDIQSEPTLRISEVQYRGSKDDPSWISASTSTFYNNEKLRAHTSCVGSGQEVSCVTATQRTCVGVIDKYQKLLNGSKSDLNPLLTKNMEQNKQNLNHCQNLLKSYGDIAMASGSNLKKNAAYDSVAQYEQKEMESELVKVFGTHRLGLVSNVGLSEAGSSLGSIKDAGKQARRSADFVGSPKGLDLVHRYLQVCLENMDKFDADRISDGSAKVNQDSAGTQ